MYMYVYIYRHIDREREVTGYRPSKLTGTGWLTKIRVSVFMDLVYVSFYWSFFVEHPPHVMTYKSNHVRGVPAARWAWCVSETWSVGRWYNHALCLPYFLNIWFHGNGIDWQQISQVCNKSMADIVPSTSPVHAGPGNRRPDCHKHQDAEVRTNRWHHGRWITSSAGRSRQ